MISPSIPEDGKRPFVLFVCHPLTGHLTPAIKIAQYLCKHSWTVFFLGPTRHEPAISASGATFIPLEHKANLNDLVYYSPASQNPPVPTYHFRSWQERALIDVELQWLDPILDQWTSVGTALSQLHAQDPDRKVIIIAEAAVHGLLPLFHGAPLPPGVKRPYAVLGLSVTVPLIRSAHLPAFGSSLQYDEHLENTQDIERKWELWSQRTAPHKALFNSRLAATRATSSFEGILLDGSIYTHYDAFLQLGVPSFFYPRTDWPSNFRFVGTIPRETRQLDCARMTRGLQECTERSKCWYHDLLASWQQGKKIVVVAQGTVETDPHQLVIPTCLAMESRSDVFVLGIIHLLSSVDFEVASHKLKGQRRLVPQADYDDVLLHAHAWVHNGGYGAVQHGIANGVPMVIAGEGQDKTENGKRLAYSGAGIDLKTARPSAESLKKAIDDILDVPTYKERVDVLRDESEDLDCYGTVAEIFSGL